MWTLRELLKRKKILRMELFVIVLIIVIIFYKLFVVVVGTANWFKSRSRPLGHYTW